MKVVFVQPEDCCGRANEAIQQLSIETFNGGRVKEDNYAVITTERWAIDDKDDIGDLVNRVLFLAENGLSE